MKMFVFNMEIIENKENSFLIKISNTKETALIQFSPENKILKFLSKNTLSSYLKENEYQIRKILHNKRPETFYKGFNLKFALRDKKEVSAFNDLSKIVVLDKRNDKNDSYVIDKGLKKIYEVFTDGSFLEKQGKGGYVVLIKDLKGKYNLNTKKTEVGSSCLIELLAAIKALELLKDIEKIRIITDSQYVRKGLTEWIINWKLNKWYTANGYKVKNIEYWEKFDSLTENKYIEFKWVKGHSNNFENTICDLYAKDTAKG